MRRRYQALALSAYKSGCLTCRETHTKCDEIRPTCSRCARLQVKCVGKGYAFSVKEVARPAEGQSKLVSGRAVRDKVIALTNSKPAAPSPSAGGSIYLHHFVTFCSKALFFADDKTDNPFSREIYRHFAGCEHLQLAVSALSAGDLRRRHPGHNEKYFNFYGRAVNKLNGALASPETATSVATLLSVMLLCFCEISSANSSAWLSHIKGARDLLVLRGGPKKDPVFARVFSLIDIGSSFFLGRETLLPVDYMDEKQGTVTSNTPIESWPCWDTTGTTIERFNQRLRIVAGLSKLSSDVKQCSLPDSRELLLAQSRNLLKDIGHHWRARIFEEDQLAKLRKSPRDQLILEDNAGRSACILSLIDITSPILDLECDSDSHNHVFLSPAVVTHHIDTILAACSLMSESYCLAGLPWPLFMAGVHLFRDQDREKAVLQALEKVSEVVFHPCEGAIRVLKILWQRQWTEGSKLSWRQLLQDSGESIYIML
ncbi:uncharacterized protein JN550_011355 [Neoarthrinium moseri]|uniref:uncharacterized protein n=1 Tax=Neoarthrinium moseri TaxID=1658444 RepID=UPI001FDE6F4D|nr:uncharacterized protein JN550_011355 [Neoarthrinium moseri]KAI1860754.1 hypothetical protein JN550_011355 [Neoarthrinium moseri]